MAKFCTNCGNSLSGDDKFCPTCGEKILSASAVKVLVAECPNCFKKLSESDKVCPACKSPVFVKIDDARSMPPPILDKYVSAYGKALAAHPEDKTLHCCTGICFLNLKLYDKAAASFEKAMADNFDNPEPFFLAAVALLQGKRPFLLDRARIDKIIEYSNAAIAIEDRGVYRYFLAYIKLDYFAQKCFKVATPWSGELLLARTRGLTEADKTFVFSLLGTAIPDELK